MGGGHQHPEWEGMDLLAAGFTIIVNGLMHLVGAIFSPTAVLLVVTGAGLAWMAVIEIEEMNRKASKPTTPLH